MNLHCCNKHNRAEAARYVQYLMLHGKLNIIAMVSCAMLQSRWIHRPHIHYLRVKLTEHPTHIWQNAKEKTSLFTFHFIEVWVFQEFQKTSFLDTASSAGK